MTLIPVWELTPVAAFVPVTVWKQVQEGIYLVMRKVLVGWRTLMRRPLTGEVHVAKG